MSSCPSISQLDAAADGSLVRNGGWKVRSTYKRRCGTWRHHARKLGQVSSRRLGNTGRQRRAAGGGQGELELAPRVGLHEEVVVIRSDPHALVDVVGAVGLDNRGRHPGNEGDGAAGGSGQHARVAAVESESGSLES